MTDLPFMYRIGPTPDLTPTERAYLLEYARAAGIQTGCGSYQSHESLVKNVGGSRTKSKIIRRKLIERGYLTPEGWSEPPTIDGIARKDRKTRVFTVHERGTVHDPSLAGTGDRFTTNGGPFEIERGSVDGPQPKPLPKPLPERGTRASARDPRTDEERELDLKWKRRQDRKAEEQERQRAALLAVYGDSAVTPEDFAATPDEALAVIAERKRQRDEDDRLHTEAVEAGPQGPPIVTRKATPDDWAAFERAKLRGLDPDIVEAMAAMSVNGADGNA
jgi:hypothetical protein